MVEVPTLNPHKPNQQHYQGQKLDKKMNVGTSKGISAVTPDIRGDPGQSSYLTES